MKIQRVAARVYHNQALRYAKTGQPIELDFHNLTKSKQNTFIQLVEDTAEAILFYTKQRKSTEVKNATRQTTEI